MHHKGAHEVEKNRAIAIARKLAMARGSGQNDQIGPEYLVAGLLKAMGTEADTLLSDLGFPVIASGLKYVPDAEPEELDRLPAAAPNQALANLLTGSLKPFIQGAANTGSALRLLLKDPAIVTALKGLVMQLQHRAVPATPSPITDILRALTRNLQTGYLLGKTYYMPNVKMPLPDYVSGKNDSVFAEAVRCFYEERRKVQMAMYSGKRGRQISLFERYMRGFGPVAADVAFTVMVNALTPFTESGGPINVRDIAWAIDPLRYHVIVRDVFEAVKLLKQHDLVRVLPEDQYHLFSILLPSEQLMDEFTGYINTRYDAFEDLIKS